MAGMDGDDVDEVIEKIERHQSNLNDANKAIEALKEFHDEVNTEWRCPPKRVLGHIAYSPPLTLGAGTEGFTEDYAVVELDKAKFQKAFQGNVIDLGAFT